MGNASGYTTAVVSGAPEGRWSCSPGLMGRGGLLSPSLNVSLLVETDAAWLMGRRYNERPSTCSEDSALWKFSGLVHVLVSLL